MSIGLGSFSVLGGQRKLVNGRVLWQFRGCIQVLGYKGGLTGGGGRHRWTLLSSDHPLGGFKPRA